MSTQANQQIKPLTLDFYLHKRQRFALFSRATEILFGGAAGGGKALAVDTPLPTPTGWTTMGEVRPGDYLIAADGKPTRVAACTEVMPDRPCYEVIFSDGSKIVADADHLWLTMDLSERTAATRRTPEFRARRRDARPSRSTGKRPYLAERNRWQIHETLEPPTGSIRTTRTIAKTIRHKGRVNHSVKVCASLDLPDVQLPVDPYSLGAWLGDGDSRYAGMTTGDPEIMGQFEMGGYEVRKRASQYGWGVLGLKAQLRDIGLLQNKHIPDCYQRASKGQRLALLQGLMDTDGYADDRGQCEFTTTSRQLRDGFLELVLGLGIKAAASKGRAKLRGVDCGPKWRIKFLTDLPAFRLQRKLDRQKRDSFRGTHDQRYIVAVNAVPSVPVKCVQVDSPSHCYLAGREMIPTHNSHLMRVAAVLWCCQIPGLQVYIFRRHFDELYKNHMEGPTSFPELLSDWINGKLVSINHSAHTIRFWNGSTIFLCHCQHEKDVYKYKGPEIHVLMIDELTQFTAKMYRFLRSRLRLGALNIPERLQGLFPRVLNGSNPGDVGHAWVKQDFVDNAPEGEIKAMPNKEGGMRRQYIRARLADNPSVDAEDYAGKLEGLGDPMLVRAMLDADWDIVAGGMFDDIWKRDIHVIKPFAIPSSWRTDRSFDWGSSAPFSVGWWAESDGTTAPNGKTYPPRTLFRINEWYGWNGRPNEGLKMLAVDIAQGIKEREAAMGINAKPGPADSNIFNAENGVCIADDMAKKGIRWTKADKSPGSRTNGWERFRQYLKAATKHPMEEPGLFVFENCAQFIRTVPVLPRDQDKMDDVDTKAEDHIGDEARYRIQTPRIILETA